jgi:transposase-like protein
MTKRNGKQDNHVAADKSDIVREIPMACADETAAVELFEQIRFGDDPFCPREGCGSLNVYQMKDREGNRNERYLWRCRDCGRQFTVRIGTVMEDSPIPLRHWAYAFWAACSSKKGVSALQIKRQTGLTYKSALFLMHRIRWAMADSNTEPLSGTVEVDETYVGGKPRKRAKGQKQRRPGRTTDFADRKTQVVALVSRDGPMRAQVRTDVRAGNLKSVVFDNVDPSAHLMTDEYVGYKGLGDSYASHETVTHSQHEYARGDVTTNTVEAFFAILKRGVYGTFHNVSRKHLHRYVSEFEFRWNNRGVDDGERTRRAILGAEGKRLTYKPVTG